MMVTYVILNVLVATMIKKKAMKWAELMLNVLYLTLMSKILSLQHEIDLKLSMRSFAFLKH